MIYAHAVSGSNEAARFLSPEEPAAAPDIASSIMQTKLETYLQFNQTFPGFAGFLPWFTSSTKEITPTYDWVNRVPGLDNGYESTVSGLSDTDSDQRAALGRVRLHPGFGEHREAILRQTRERLAELA